MMDGYSEPYHFDKNRNGGMTFIQEGIPYKLIADHKLTNGIDGIFVELNVRKKN